MRILILNQPFFPDVVATAQIAKDLADALVRREHDVTVIASRSLYGRTGATQPARETVDGISVLRVGTSRFGKQGTLGWLTDMASYYLQASLRGLGSRRFDAVVCLTTPPFIAAAGLALRMFRGTRVLYWMMDVYPDVIVAHGMLARGGAAHRILRRAHRAILDRVDDTVVLGRCMKERLVAQGADPDRVHVLPVWPVNGSGDAGPARDKNPYRRQWEVGNDTLVMYAGNFGLAHDVETFLEAAAMLQDDPRFRFAFVGDGRRKPEVEAFVRRHKLTRCVLSGYQPRERLTDLLTAADIHLVTMRPDWWGLVVPSKFSGIAAAGRPTVFVGPQQSEIAKSIAEWGCGLSVAPGDPAALKAALLGLATHPEQREAMARRARRAARRWLDPQLLCAQLCGLIEHGVVPRSTRPPVLRNPGTRAEAAS